MNPWLRTVLILTSVTLLEPAVTAAQQTATAQQAPAAQQPQAPAPQQAPAPPRCDAAEFRQFDFWLGTWDVHTPNGKLAGTNRIEREYDGCVVHERYTGAKTYRGESLNTYDAARKVWHQTWVDNQGTLLLLEGGLRGDSMVLEGGPAGPSGRQRITWTPNADGSVRQLWESSDESGSWKTVFDGKYTHK